MAEIQKHSRVLSLSKLPGEWCNLCVGAKPVFQAFIRRWGISRCGWCFTGWWIRFHKFITESTVLSPADIFTSKAGLIWDKKIRGIMESKNEQNRLFLSSASMEGKASSYRLIRVDFVTRRGALRPGDRESKGSLSDFHVVVSLWSCVFFR